MAEIEGFEGEVESRADKLSKSVDRDLNALLYREDSMLWPEVGLLDEFSEKARKIVNRDESQEILEDDIFWQKLHEMLKITFNSEQFVQLNSFLDKLRLVSNEDRDLILTQLINLQEQRMRILGVDSGVKINGLNHIKSVVYLIKRANPADVTALSWIGAVHDIVKYSAKQSADVIGVTDLERYLGLHEPASAMVGGRVLETVLMNDEVRKLIDSDDGKYEDNVALFVQLAEIAILNHGYGEYPDLVSRSNPTAELDSLQIRLFGDSEVYVSAYREIMSDESFEDASCVDRLDVIVGGLREADLLEGCTVGALKKYNRGYTWDGVLKFGSIEVYLKNLLSTSVNNLASNPDVLRLKDSMTEDIERVRNIDSQISAKTAELSRIWQILQFDLEQFDGVNVSEHKRKLKNAFDIMLDHFFDSVS